MTKPKDEKERQRKVYAKNGTRGQQPFTFRVDNENLAHLESQPNKGRYLNELIRKDMEQEKGR